MVKIDVYNTEGKKKKEVNLAPYIFNTRVNQDLLHQVIIAYKANKRKIIANTKTRSEKRGGGRKPWRQKGTGRARAGSIRSPIWRGGGVIFGPKAERNYRKKIPKIIKKQATRMALSVKAKNNQILLLDRLSIKRPKTKKLAEILDNLPTRGTILLVLPKKDEAVQKAAQNIPYLKVLPVSLINAFNLVKFNYLVISQKAIQFLEEKYSNKGDENVKKQQSSTGKTNGYRKSGR
jgi:large subunit ribosomal protein L4